MAGIKAVIFNFANNIRRKTIFSIWPEIEFLCDKNNCETNELFFGIRKGLLYLSLARYENAIVIELKAFKIKIVNQCNIVLL